MKSILLLLFLIKTYYCFNAPINNILSKSLIASSLIYNPIQETTYMGKYHKETIQYEKNDNTDFFKSASIKMENYDDESLTKMFDVNLRWLNTACRRHGTGIYGSNTYYTIMYSLRLCA